MTRPSEHDADWSTIESIMAGVRGGEPVTWPVEVRVVSVYKMPLWYATRAHKHAPMSVHKRAAERAYGGKVAPVMTLNDGDERPSYVWRDAS